MEGIQEIAPEIDKIDFRIKGTIRLFLKDGRQVVAPLKYFPSIKRLSEKEKKKYHIIDGQILLFDHCDEIFHIEQFLGKEQNYRYHFTNSIAAEAPAKYGKR
jgi:hypothetical protein